MALSVALTRRAYRFLVPSLAFPLPSFPSLPSLGRKLGLQRRDHVCHRVPFSAEVLLELVDRHILLVHPLSGGVEAELEVVELLVELTIVVLQTQVSADFVPFS